MDGLNLYNGQTDVGYTEKQKDGQRYVKEEMIIDQDL